MSLAIDLTQCQARLADASHKASAEARALKAVAPVEIYNELMLQLCALTSETNNLKSLLGSLRMIGELEQRPSPVTAETLELAACMPPRQDDAAPSLFPDHPVDPPGAAYWRSLRAAGDHTLDEEVRQ
jgi:hypothetical protein